ncbi:MAG: DNA repair protein RadA [Patescibacteria group bacterium]|nr:DNA repair protein RadA [Patescibacteria group bacterium]
MKSKAQYRCKECGCVSPRWLGKCLECNAWNSFVEEQVVKNPRKSSLRAALPAALITTMADVKKSVYKKLSTGNSEIDNVLGGGLNLGGVYLLSGDPGVGKSTLAMQISIDLAKKNHSVFYVSGEESIEQISDRASRLGANGAEVKNLHFISDSNLESILASLGGRRCAFMVFDSVQTLASLDIDSSSGSPTQVREVCSQIVDFAKKANVPTLLIGHITKSGDLAGPKFLEHLVDAVLFLEGSKEHSFRLLRGLKNRFGSVEETGVFEMMETGLAPIKNPSEYLLRGRIENAQGAVITSVIEGNRPLLLEIQALTSRSGFGYPKRTASGFDLTRTQLIIGILQKHAGLKLENDDVFVNVVGGFRIQDRSADLAVALAIASSFLGKVLPKDLVTFGEIGLSGEIRVVSNMDRRIREARKLGFKKILGPAGLEKSAGVYPLTNIAEAVKRLREM